MSDLVRQARQELIRAGLCGELRTDGVVPDLIVRSWRRSLSGSVDSTTLQQRFQEVDTDSLLCRAAGPVLDRWQERLAGTGATVFLSDRAGNIVARRAGDRTVLRRLDQVHAAEGFDYSEDSVGTNGLGTAMVERRAVYIEGSQHYNDALAALACAAAPVVAPTGTVLGSVSVGGPIEVANPLMLSLTREIGQQIEERLRADSRPEDLALAMSFMRFSNSQRPTVVLDQESMLANNPGLPYVSVHSHVALWELLQSHDWSGTDTAQLLLDGSGVEIRARRVAEGPRSHFVLHFSEPDSDERHAPFALPPAEKPKPLARTPERIPALVKDVLARIDQEGPHSISPAALQALMQWDWPGDLAELTDLLTQLVREVPGTVIQRRDLPQHLQRMPPRRALTPLERAERDAISNALDAAGGNKSEAAATLGIGRTTLYRRLRQLGLDGDESSL